MIAFASGRILFEMHMQIEMEFLFKCPNLLISIKNIDALVHKQGTMCLNSVW